MFGPPMGRCACIGHDPSGWIVVTLSLVAAPPPAPTQSIEPDPLDVRLHAPTTDTVIVWVAGPIRRADAPLLTLRVRQQFERALHVILDLSSVTRLDPTVAADLRDLEAHADSRGCRLHIAGAASERQPDRREHPPETRAATGIPRGQARDLLDEGPLRAARTVAEEPPDL